VSQKAEWRRFVERRRSELHDAYPCAMPTRRRVCPKHHHRIVEVCKPCRDELYEQLAAEYTAAPTRQEGEHTVSETTTELVEYEPDTTEPPAGPLTLFGTSDPRIALERMAEVATVLVDVIRDRKLIARINGREHLTAEAWTTLGGMLGVVPVVVWTRQLEDGTGWEARVEARTLDGRVVGAAESMCTRSEQHWRGRDEFALRSMAQTRAIGRALRAPLGQIIRLAGYDPTGAEELPGEPAAARAEPKRDDAGSPPVAAKPTPEQVRRMRELLAQLAEHNPDVDWPATARELAGVPGDMLTRTGANALIERLRDMASETESADA
jgi:hypothetical protein